MRTLTNIVILHTKNCRRMRKEEKFKVLLYLKRSAVDKEGKMPVMGRITVGRTVSQFSCKLSCAPELWGQREGRLVGKSREAVEANAKLNAIVLAINSAYDRMKRDCVVFTAEDVRNASQGRLTPNAMLVASFQKMTDEMKKRVGVDRALSTWHNFSCALPRIAGFVKLKYGTADVPFSLLEENFISDFSDYLSTTKKLGVSSVRATCILLKKVCRKAFENGDTDRLLFAHFKTEQEKMGTPRTLDKEDFIKIRDVVIPDKCERVSLARDLFLFGCYTGTAFIDTVSVKKENISKDNQGHTWLTYNRQKTGVIARVVLFPQALDLIEKYRDDNRDTLFPDCTYDEIRTNLFLVANLAQVKRKVTFHMARHSFASLMTLNEGVPMETISKMLGHSTVRMTERYARVTPKKLFEDMQLMVEHTKDWKFNI